MVRPDGRHALLRRGRSPRSHWRRLGSEARRAAPREPAQQDHDAARSPRDLSRAFRRCGVRQRAEREARLDHRLRAPFQSGAPSRLESGVRGLRIERSSPPARGLRGESPAQPNGHMSEMRLGLRENLPQFALLVVLNSFVGAMVGLERTVLRLLGEQEFGLSSKTAITSFIVSFGVTKAIINLIAARASDRIGRKPILVVGWLFALPVPFLIIYAPAWWWIDLANVLLGANQAMAWSMTVIMKIDLVGPKRRGLALGLNEFAGYFAVGVMSWVTGYIAAHSALRPQPFYLGIVIAIVGITMSALFVRETRPYAHLEAATSLQTSSGGVRPSLQNVFYVTSLGNVSLFAACQAGLVNNLNDGMSWGLYPLFFGAYGLGVDSIWRDLGYAIGALLSGAVADLVGIAAAIHLVAALTFVSGLVVARLMGQTRPRPALAHP